MKNNIDINSTRIGVVGAGSWGTAIANHLGSKGFKVDLWVFEKEVKDQISNYRENKIFLPGFTLSSNIFPSNDLSSVASDKDLLIIVVPSHLMRETVSRITGLISKDTIILSASKGIENKTHLTMSGVLKEALPEISDNRLVVLSGPSFAKEVANKVPTLVTVASKNKSAAEFVQHVFSSPYFRAYTTDDLIGVELGGSVKNVIAIAAGIIDGLGFGLNTRAALITRGLTEMRRLGLKLGASTNTFSGLAGIGDLILTCTGDLSRNYTVGKKIGEGKKLNEILSEMRMVAEGVKTAKSIYNLSKKISVEMPICQETYHILYNDVSPNEAARRLMSRDLKQEMDE
ncbi:MAG: NAD(P)H-dependent glycerol-3-phosphate dehydrogenase [Proteobacteria bacterium]|nr:NAD(P)H-dependent glycerol-3-phosphate dehydrogenase [Pseudomonadota bacterium]MCG2830707.1 NAD(P)H-dependent glycerol-3-phosphate dehydrogenase [Desulfobacteraceae bacterium]MBU3979970.1 NAD(P)H-dependent glycerol-3-phosphate dehydrogenase [Pseudomonadota bacterium]MBU4012545.1 NAD(P)H-dependent glycerol-3-phosphate dehydrogenase [Pseudomonadota bacterium]MBU4068337.1 NAD(P)H-dependent glycerol-3-phosphate dehydrogenase [Pseudomonadota bacterium]